MSLLGSGTIGFLVSFLGGLILGGWMAAIWSVLCFVAGLGLMLYLMGQPPTHL